VSEGGGLNWRSRTMTAIGSSCRRSLVWRSLRSRRARWLCCGAAVHKVIGKRGEPVRGIVDFPGSSGLAFAVQPFQVGGVLFDAVALSAGRWAASRGSRVCAGFGATGCRLVGGGVLSRV
jgi:hypothetical protein